MLLANYLAKKYLTADASTDNKPKKRKRKDTTAPSAGLIIAEDDVLGWNSGNANGDNEDGPTTVSGNSAEFRKAKKNSWKAVGTQAPSNADQAAADAIIASAAAESNANRNADEDEPEVLDQDGVLKMESGAHAGLQTADQVTAALQHRQAAERKAFERMGAEAAGKGRETIYRDATGRIINVAMKRAEARRQADEEERKKAAELEAQKGDVQLAQKEVRKKQLEDAKLMTVSRYADDTELNKELKERDRWNDPAAQFLTKKKAGKSVTGKPLYKGAAAPNRYGIRPGHRWDGVDRGNGFEKEYFAAQNRRKNVKDLQYAWQMDE
ncbi:Pre-mRNA-splicing factor cwc26 [Cryomyces antarcticus]|uniref:Pre-mRNA-splicing factor cwc26 n=1 Tax=Cryomyces antarcticus TaxID=329879 RepID=A0ABR0LZC4_9PEZI|nr:Pre-mRNA-splicing factor cwc26 [Cryomyces antarcticus]KAK5018053.1 Pre-mRNA-splicing factor cwc26 [Cryomyces antarcticus]KAK5257065.1 Pre-mRNA-splicing factor cwc26 [Cryomyces antarcticus]